MVAVAAYPPIGGAQPTPSSIGKTPTRQDRAPIPVPPAKPLPAASQTILGTGPSDDRNEYFRMLAEQNRVVQEAQRPQRQSFMPKDCLPAEPNANRKRILKLFHETPYSGELLPSGRIWYDNREMTPEQWERARFRAS
jgi:hypothetical protein